jgi:hypothetical protein
MSRFLDLINGKPEISIPNSKVVEKQKVPVEETNVKKESSSLPIISVDK